MSWTSRLQKATALLTNKTEINAPNKVDKDLVWLKRVLSELFSDFARKSPILYIDNASVIKVTKNPEYHERLKHIEVQYFYVRETYSVHWWRHWDRTHWRKKTTADLLIKPIEHVRCEILYREIGITPDEQLNDLCNVCCVTVFWKMW